jgi:cation diffusion facilitator family transporter
MIDVTSADRLHPAANRDRQVNGVLWKVLVLNLLVAVLKLIFGFLSGALSMIADGFHSALDASSNIVGLVGMKLAGKEADPEHPYGHRKFEALAALAIALFLFITCYEVLSQVVERFHEPRAVKPESITFIVMLFTMGVNFGVSRYERREGTRLRSLILVADSRHTQSDIFASFGVLVSLAAALLGFPALDLVVAVAIAGFIAYSGYQIVSQAFTALADAQMVDPGMITEIVRGVDGVTHVHRVRSRGLPDDIHIDLHVHVSPQMSIAEAHKLAHVASERIRREIKGTTDVVIHVEPEGDHEE